MLRIVAVLVVLAFPAHAGEVTGKVRIIDGDTLDVGSVRERLFRPRENEAGAG